MKTLMIAGGRGGLGRVGAGKLAQAGYRAVLVARTQAAAEAAGAQIRTHDPGADVGPRPADLASVRALAAALVDDAGRIDVVFSITGVLQPRPSRRVTAG